MGFPERPTTKNIRKQHPKKSKIGNRLGLIQNLVVVTENQTVPLQAKDESWVINGFKLGAQFYVVINKASDECSCCPGSVDSASLGETDCSKF